jgi:prolyl oligopeptidase
VAASVLQYPDVYGAGVAVVPVADMLRFHKFTIGYAWQTDYGYPDSNRSQLTALMDYSPVHNVEQGKRYPAVMVMTADHDDRVVPLHSFKLVAALQCANEAQSIADPPVLLRVDTKAGHGAGKTTCKRIEDAAARWAFLETCLHH